MGFFRRISRFLHTASNLKQAVGVLFVTVLMSNILGLVRNIIIANRVGITYGSIGPLDNYYAAFTLPDLLYNILIVGALSSAILPLLVKIDTEESEENFWRAFNTLLSSGITVIIFGLAIVYLFLPYIVRLMFPGFNAADLQNTAQMTRVMLFSPLFFTISQITTSALQAKKRFVAPAIGPLVYNIAIIIAALLIPRAGISVLVLGVIIGAVCHFLIQLPSLLQLGWKFEFRLGMKNPLVHKVITLMVPRTIALTSTQLLLIAFYAIASHFSPGAITIYTLTDDLQTAPVLLLANTLAMAILPDFARHFAKSEHNEFKLLIGRAMRVLLFIFLPATVFLLMFRSEIMSVYISVGHSISAAETAKAVRTFAYFVLSLFFQGAVLILARAYFARSDTYRPTLYSVISLAVAWSLALLLASHSNLDVAGLALSFSVGSILNALLLWFNLRLPLHTLWRDDQGRHNFWPLALGTGLLMLLLYIFQALGSPIILHATHSKTIVTAAFILAGLALTIGFYLLWCSILNLEQWQLIKPNKSSTER